MADTVKATLEMFKKHRPEMKERIPGVMDGFFGCLKAAESDGELSHKIKELVTLGIAIAIRCDFCIAAHLDACLRAGASRQEILEVCGVAVAMGGGPGYTYTAYVLECLDELEGTNED